MDRITASLEGQVRTTGLLRIHLEAGVCQVRGQLEVGGCLGARDRARLDAQRQVAGHEARQVLHVKRQVVAVRAAKNDQISSPFTFTNS